MVATHELWEMRSGNLVGAWSMEADVLAVVRDALDRQGEEMVESLSLLMEDAQGETTVIAEGEALVKRAQQQARPPGQRSA